MTETLCDSIGQTQLRNLAAFLTAPPPGTAPSANR